MQRSAAVALFCLGAATTVGGFQTCGSGGIRCARRRPQSTRVRARLSSSALNVEARRSLDGWVGSSAGRYPARRRSSLGFSADPNDFVSGVVAERGRGHYRYSIGCYDTFVLYEVGCRKGRIKGQGGGLKLLDFVQTVPFAVKTVEMKKIVAIVLCATALLYCAVHLLG